MSISNYVQGASRARVTAGDTVGQLLAANTARRGAVIFNEAATDLYVALGSAATVTDYTVKLVAANGWEVPFGYSGVITAVRGTGNTGAVQVTELS